MDDFLVFLWSLQDLDHQRVKVLKDRGQVGESTEREDLAAALARAETLIGENSTRLNRVRGTFKQLELDLRTIEAHLAQSEKRLYGGEVSNPKELSQLEHRVSEERARRSQLESTYLGLMEELEQLEHQFTQAGANANIAREQLIETDRELKRQQLLNTTLDREYEEKRKTLLTELPAQIRQKYERIQAHHSGTAFVRIERGNCGGCHNALAQAEIERAARMPGVTTCENCGRLLAPDIDAGKTG